MKKWVLVGTAMAAVLGISLIWWKTGSSSPIKVTTGNGSYTVHGKALKWFPNSDTLEVKVDTKTISIKLREYPQATVIGPNPKNRYNTTILVKSQYTSQEWERAFCKDDLLLIGTKDNIWPKIKNYMQIEPDFVNVEDRPCYNLPAK